VITLIDDTGRGESLKQRPGEPDVLVKMTFAVYRMHLPMASGDVALLAGDDLIDLTWFSVADLQDLQLTPPARAYIAEHGLAWLTQ
jgi:hypothetical protein